MFDAVQNGETLKFYLDEYTGVEEYSWEWTSDCNDDLKITINQLTSEPDAALITFETDENSELVGEERIIRLTGTTRSEGAEDKTIVWEITYWFEDEDIIIMG